MTNKIRTRGDCVFCGKELTRGGLAHHLAACDKRQAAIEAANQEKVGVNQQLFRLQVQDAWGGDYWLHLEINGETTLKQLDRYLRAIWLECCGHLSRFSVGGGWHGKEVGMGAIAKRTLRPGLELTHIYDFGTSSETLVKVVDMRTGYPLSQHPIYLMARNNPIASACQECGQPAQWLCIECISETDATGLLCDEHIKEHPHENYDRPRAVVNSPRMGMCGYTGPAKPPY
jgi:hypothetical protein